MYDIAIIGAGVIGCAIARELSKYQGDFILIEKEADVSMGASKANSGIVHGGYDATHGSNKAYYSRRGNAYFDQLEKELHFGFKRIGSLVLAFEDGDLTSLAKLKENGEKNGVKDLGILSREEVLALEPHVNNEIVGALYCPSAGIVSPYEMTIALAENAVKNGVELALETEVMEAKRQGDFWHLRTGSQREIKAKWVINCAGVHSGKLAALFEDAFFSIIPRRGEYVLLNKDQGEMIQHVLFQPPSKKGKGVLVTKTVHGNLMIGPNAQEIDELGDVSTDREVLKQVVEKARKTLPGFDLRYTLKTFAGIRPTSNQHDFIIEKRPDKKLFHVAGIESPGLTAAPAIAAYVVEKMGPFKRKDDFDPHRKPVLVAKDETFSGHVAAEDPQEKIICRCEKVTKAEILDSLQREIPITTVDSVKFRTRAGMGPCQGNYCKDRVKKIIGAYLDISPDQVKERSESSESIKTRVDRTFWKDLEKERATKK